MTALRSPDTYYPFAVPVTALDRAEAATLDYCTTTAREQAHAKLRELSPLDAMYAYFGSDEAQG
ncbi:MAG: hypothetical protein Q7J44_23170 [Pseudotabrizicola sp.]|uniref:hypothetical protein n=1 Tax=Pseudotabrizicola sp. TaxID=2939647 RepID=UPI002726F591|nr:hypothetical protein [Pseudotabrizicola sp.]MDO9641439.1 hypothetical protein [Pseudotabrizicola sp.]